MNQSQWLFWKLHQSHGRIPGWYTEWYTRWSDLTPCFEIGIAEHFLGIATRHMKYFLGIVKIISIIHYKNVNIILYEFNTNWNQFFIIFQDPFRFSYRYLYTGICAVQLGSVKKNIFGRYFYHNIISFWTCNNDI